MSEPMTEAVKRWSAKRRSALVVEVIVGKTMMAEASRTFDLSPSEIESWVDDAGKDMERAFVRHWSEDNGEWTPPETTRFGGDGLIHSG